MNLTLKFAVEPLPKQSTRSLIKYRPIPPEVYHKNQWLKRVPKEFKVIHKKAQPFTSFYQPSVVVNYENALKMAARSQVGPKWKPYDGPVVVDRLVFCFKPPKSIRSDEKVIIEQGGTLPKITKPDVTDNLLKPFFDALEGIVYTNDSRIYKMNNISKVYYRTPGIVVDFLFPE